MARSLAAARRARGYVASLGGGLSPFLINFKTSNTTKIRAGMASTTRNAIIPIIGPSTTAGQTTGGGTSQAVGSWPYQLAALLQAQGINASGQNFFGNHAGYGAGTAITALEAGDSRISHTAGGAAIGVDTVGGNALGFAAAGSLTFAPSAPVRKWKNWTGNVATGRNMTATSGTSGDVAINSVASNTITETIIDSGSLGINPLTLTWVSGSCSVLGVYGYDDTGSRRETAFLNLGISGAASARFIENVDTLGRGSLAMLNKLAPDGVILDDWPINDWRTSVLVSTFQANLQTGIDQARAAGADVILTTPLWDNATTGNALNQNDYAAVVIALGASNDLPVVDVRGLFGSYAAANAKGYYSDPVHPTVAGYAAKAALMQQAIQRIRALA